MVIPNLIAFYTSGQVLSTILVQSPNLARLHRETQRELRSSFYSLRTPVSGCSQ